MSSLSITPKLPFGLLYDVYINAESIPVTLNPNHKYVMNVTDIYNVTNTDGMACQVGYKMKVRDQTGSIVQ